MGDKTGIQWTDATWNPVRGCSRVSAGCDNCYAMGQAHRFSGTGKAYDGLTTIRRGKVDWAGKARLHPAALVQPLRWTRPRRIFVNSMSDLFHSSLTNEEIAAVFGVMAAAPQHTFQVLTKRPKRALEWFEWARNGAVARVACFADDALEQRMTRASRALLFAQGRGAQSWPLPNVHLGVSVEDQRAADERIPLLLQTPAAVRFISAEPLLGPLELSSFMPRHAVSEHGDCASWCSACGPTEPKPRLDWVIVGGESGPGARTCGVEWIRSIVRDCKAASVPVFVKQLGVKPYRSVSEATRGMGGIGLGLKHKKGADPDEWPADLRVRELPEEAPRA